MRTTFPTTTRAGRVAGRRLSDYYNVCIRFVVVVVVGGNDMWGWHGTGISNIHHIVRLSGGVKLTSSGGTSYE